MTRNELDEIVPAKQNRLDKRHAGGMTIFEPTDEQRRIVERAAGLGLRQDKVCQLIISPRTNGPISKETLEKHFRAELDRGMALADYAVAKSLYDQAVGGNVTAQIWWTKARMGWKETQVVENRATGFEGMSAEEIAKEIEERANKLGVKIKLSID